MTELGPEQAAYALGTPVALRSVLAALGATLRLRDGAMALTYEPPFDRLLG